MEPTKAHPKLCINPLRVTKSYTFLVPDTSKLQHYNNGKMHNKFPDNVNFSIFHWFKHFMLVPKEHRLWCRNQVQTSPLAKTKQDWKLETVSQVVQIYFANIEGETWKNILDGVADTAWIHGHNARRSFDKKILYFYDLNNGPFFMDFELQWS